MLVLAANVFYGFPLKASGRRGQRGQLLACLRLRLMLRPLQREDKLMRNYYQVLRAFN
jgi:hypothetical protein